MSMTLWLRLWNLMAVITICILLSFLLRLWRPDVAESVGKAGVIMIWPLLLIEGVLILLAVFGFRPIICPFCGSRGKASGHRQGLYLECPKCGMVHGKPGRDWSCRRLRDDPPRRGGKETGDGTR